MLRNFCEQNDPETCNGFIYSRYMLYILYIPDKLEEEKKALA